MKKAIFDLFERPFNRFKIFRNGKVLYTETRGEQASLQQEIQGWLGPTSNDGKVKDDGKNIHRLASLLCTALLCPIEKDDLSANESMMSSSNSIIVPPRVKENRNNFLATTNFDTMRLTSEESYAFNATQQAKNCINQDAEQSKF